MLQNIIFFIKTKKNQYPSLYNSLVGFARKYLGKILGVYPRPLANEVSAVKKVLFSSEWNMAYGKGLTHEKLEEEFAQYVGSKHAIAVNTGGMAIQMSLRALGLLPGDEVIMQADTCSATAFAVMNSFCTPIFADASEKTFMLSPEDTLDKISGTTKAILATHMWGNAEDISSIQKICREKKIFMIEDACLSLGTISEGKFAGTHGIVGVYSFGCLKPIQGGEGGMIVTNDESLAKELKSLRHWGDRAIDFGIRDTTQLAWNGRMSEILAAVVREQLKGYPQYLQNLRENVEHFDAFLKREIPSVSLNIGSCRNIKEAAYTQVVASLDDKIHKQSFRDSLQARGISTWHANFEQINTLSFFKENSWEKWMLKGDIDFAKKNYHSHFINSQKIFDAKGIGFNKSYFTSISRLNHLKRQIKEIIGKY